MSLLDLINPASWVGALVGSIGGKVADSVLGWHKDSLDAANQEARIRADLAQSVVRRDAAEDAARTQLKIAEIGHWYEPEKLFAYVILFYFAKIYVYDAALGLGSTDAVRGSASDWAGMIMMFYFGKRGVENVVRIMKR